MAFKVPRAERRTEDPSGVFQGRAVAPTAGAQATEQLGRAITGLGRVASELGDRETRRTNEENLNRAVDASNKIQQDLVPFLADEKGKAGLDSIGGTGRHDDFMEERFQFHTSELSDEAKALTFQRLQDPRLKNRTALATHEVEQRKGVTLSNLDQARDIAVGKVSNSPSVDTIVEELKGVSELVNSYRANGSIGAEDAEDRVIEARETLITSAVTSAMLQDAETGQALLDQTKAVLPPELVKSLEADIRKQAKIQKEEIEIARTEAVQDFTNEIIDQSIEGAATLTQAQSSPIWDTMTPSEKKDVKSIITNSDPFNESDPVTLANFTTLVNADPASLTKDDFVEAHGKGGLSTDDFNRLFKQWDTNIKQARSGKIDDPLQKQYEAQAYRLIEFTRKDVGFVDAGGFFTGASEEELAENDLRAATQVNSLARYIEENPKEDYVETYIKPVLKPVQEGFVANVYNRVSAFVSDEPFISVEEDIEVRRQAADLLTKSGVKATKEEIDRVSAQIREGNAELKILDDDTAQRLFKSASGRTDKEKAENARRTARKLGFTIP